MKYLRLLLFPFALLYGVVIAVRNKLYDRGVFPSKSYDFPVICVGNLSMGGTGKSPMIEYLLRMLESRKPTAVLSRGYKRITKGFHLLSGREKTEETGDEPAQFKQNFPDALIVVDEDRRHGIEILREQNPPPEVILLDDAFQHRKANAGLNILLTTYSNPYYKDFMLPAGNLREPRDGAKRADIVVVTKCPDNLSLEKQKEIKEKIGLAPHQELYFSKISYSENVVSEKESKPLTDLSKFTLVTGIADPKPLVRHLKNSGLEFEHLGFADHHNFSPIELKKLNQKETLVTTEKDYMRLKTNLKNTRLFYLPIKVGFLERENDFEVRILDFISGN